MKLILQKLILLSLVIYAAIASSPTSFAQSALKAGGPQGAALTDKGWPRKLVNGANSFTVYQPQIEEWQGNRLQARARVIAASLAAGSLAAAARVSAVAAVDNASPAEAVKE